MKKSVLSKILAFFLLVGFFYLKPGQALAYYGEKYEPADGRIYHGMGQYITYFYSEQENWQYLTEYQQATGKVPLLYEAYYSINPKLDQVPFNSLNLNPNLSRLVQIGGNCQLANHNCPYIILLGIGYLDFEESDLLSGGFNFANSRVNPEAILRGDWDGKIRQLAREIKQLGSPFLLRPGWEFGIGSDGVHQQANLTPAVFIACWRRIQDIFTQEQVNNVAWVWSLVNPNQFDYLSYYPGDERVDWWAINYFTTDQINNGDGFLEAARNHQKPVLIGESCPIHNGGTENSSNWNSWFLPYFEKIKANSHIKAFIYISNPWDKSNFWEDWADSRININPTIRANYATEMANSRYVHMNEYLANPNVIYGDSLPIPPPTLTGDLNSDNVVNILDLVIVGSNFGKDYNNAGTDKRADANGDRVINILDLVIVGSNFGK